MFDTTVNSYTFDNLTGLRNDECSMDQRNVQNVQASNYMTENYYPFCPMTNAIDFATKQANVFYNGSHQVGINGCNIDTNSELKYTKIAKPACKITLQERPFLTVPYLGRGEVDPVLERQIKAGDNQLNKKTVNPSMEVNFSEKRNYPLIDNIKNSVTNPNNLIESVADPNWVRGGLPSRDFCKKNQQSK